MNLVQTNDGPMWLFDDGECRDFAYIAACLPTDRMSSRDRDFLLRVEIKFRRERGGHLTPGQWEWFAGLADRWGAFIQEQTDAPAAIRALAAGGAA